MNGNFNRVWVVLFAAVIVMCCGCARGLSEDTGGEITAKEITVTAIYDETGISAETDKPGKMGTYAETEAVSTESASKIQTTESAEAHKTNSWEEAMYLYITVGDTVLTANLEDNTSAEALVELLKENPLTVQMSDYAGMEKVGTIGTSLPRNDKQISVSAGDVILYQGNQITIYYGTNSWNFTKLAAIENVTGDELLAILGSDEVEVTFSIE